MAFMIIGHLGAPVYELLDFAATRREDVARNAQFLLHASLDSVDLAAASPATSSTYLKVVDRHQEQLVSAYVTPGGARFLVLHDARNEVRRSPRRVAKRLEGPAASILSLSLFYAHCPRARRRAFAPFATRCTSCTLRCCSTPFTRRAAG